MVRYNTVCLFSLSSFTVWRKSELKQSTGSSVWSRSSPQGHPGFNPGERRSCPIIKHNLFPRKGGVVRTSIETDGFFWGDKRDRRLLVGKPTTSTGGWGSFYQGERRSCPIINHNFFPRKGGVVRTSTGETRETSSFYCGLKLSILHNEYF